jgi:hypothetical protein
MRVDEGLLRAYLDGELAPLEREQVERWLSSSPKAQARLVQLRQTREQVHQALAALMPPAPSSAVVALKRLQPHLEPRLSQNGVPAKNPSATVWESPSLLAELKSDVKNMRYTWRKTVTKGFILAFVVSLVVVISAVALAVWPNLGYRVTEQLQQVAPAEGVNLPVAEANKPETTTVVIALQPISRGAEFVPGSIGQRSWPTPHLPAGFISSETETVGKIARTDIAAGQVIVQGMLVDASAPLTPELPPDAVPVSAVFNHEIELVGYKLQSDALTSPGTIDLTLYWRSVQEVANDYTVFIHLADANGLLLAQEDSPLGQGKFPTSRWSPGQLIEDEHHLLIAENLPDGKYDLKVGLYNSATGERLSVQSENGPVPDNSFLLTQIKVGQAEEVATHFGYGIQVAPNGDTAANIGHLKRLGMEWVKFQMPWKEVEPAQGVYEWAFWDETIAAYAANGINVMLIIVKAPDWARPADDDKSVEGPPADPDTYAKFVTQVTERYRGKAQAIEIWNEQNLWYESGGAGRIDAAKYVELLRLTYQAVKAVNQDMLVISGGLTPAGNVADPKNSQVELAVDDVEYLEQMYANGAKDYFDALGAHPASYNCPALADWQTVTPEEASADPNSGMFVHRHHSWCFLGTMEAYRAVMAANADEAKPVWPTEFGWASASEPTPGYEYAGDNTPEEQAQWIVEAFQWGKRQGWVGPMFLWNLDYSLVLPGTELGYFSILDTPAYEVLAKPHMMADTISAEINFAEAAFELKDVRQLTPCENKGRRLLLVQVLDMAGRGLDDVPVKIQWGYEAFDQVTVRTKTINQEPGRVEFEMTEETPYAVEIQAASSQVASDLTPIYAQEEACAEGGSGNSPGHISYEIIFQETEAIPPAATVTPIPSNTAPLPAENLFGYGIQADPLGDAAANVEHVKTLGFGWVKFQMDWKEVEPVAGDYKWVAWDKVIDAYAASDINVMLAVVKAPDWARPAEDDKSIEGLPADPVKYAEFVAQISDRYRGKVQAIEVWNEQNLWYKTGGKGRMDAAKYVQLLQAAYQAIKSVNQEMMVISGAISPAGDVGDLAVDDVEYLKQMYANGVKDSFDALGATPWGYNCPALADWRTVTATAASADAQHGTFTNRHHSWCFLGTMEAYREVMIANDDGDKPIAITGFGWAVAADAPSGYEFARDNTPAEQAQWMVEAYQWAKNQGWVGPMILWNLDYSLTIPGTELGYYSILNTSAYDALVKMPK